MAGPEVSSVISDIIDAFKNGLSVFKKTGRRHKRRHSEPASTTEEKRLHDSLSLRPKEIKHAYDQSVTRHGRQFEVGDGTSQRSLAQILMVLNTGLIRLLNHALDHKSHPQSRNSFFDLSETAAMGTLTALSELNVRLLSSSRIDLGLTPPKLEGSKAHSHRHRPKAESAVPAPKRPLISPQLRQHGGYIRSKSDPSVITIVLGNKAKKGDQKLGAESGAPDASSRKSSTDSSPTRTPVSKSPPPSYSQLAGKADPANKTVPTDSHVMTEAPIYANRRERNASQPVRQPSMYIVPSDFFSQIPLSETSYSQAQGIDVLGRLPLVPPKVPLHSRPQQRVEVEQGCLDIPRNRRERPPSMMTFMTASTKIGEIPEHRLPDFEPTAKQPQQVSEQFVDPDMLYPLKKKGKGLKFWKKDKYERNPMAPVFA